MFTCFYSRVLSYFRAVVSVIVIAFLSSVHYFTIGFYSYFIPTVCFWNKWLIDWYRVNLQCSSRLPTRIVDIIIYAWSSAVTEIPKQRAALRPLCCTQWWTLQCNKLVTIVCRNKLTTLATVDVLILQCSDDFWEQQKGFVAYNSSKAERIWTKRVL